MRYTLFTARERRLILALLSGEKIDARVAADLRYKARKHRATIEEDIALFKRFVEIL